MYPFIREPRISLKLRYLLIYPTPTSTKPSLPHSQLKGRCPHKDPAKNLQLGKYLGPLSLVPGVVFQSWKESANYCNWFELESLIHIFDMSQDEYLLISTTLLAVLHIKREAIQVIHKLYP